MFFVKVLMLMLLSLYFYLFYWLVIDNSDSLNHSLWCLVNTSLLSRVGGETDGATLVSAVLSTFFDKIKSIMRRNYCPICMQTGALLILT